jgi:hypothetical protein
VRWTIGPVTKSGFQSLALSIASFQHFYPDTDALVCFNCDKELLHWLPSNVDKYDQHTHQNDPLPPMGVAWKLYPPRIAPDRHELFIDNDIVFLNHIPEIDYFFNNDVTLLLEGLSRNYGRYERHVPPAYSINSGIFGCPPGFNLNKYVKFFGGSEWQQNAHGEHAASKTFDEQGLVALALLEYRKFVIIPNTSVTDCSRQLIKGQGLHFIGVNRNEYHRPFRLFRNQLSIKVYL